MFILNTYNAREAASNVAVTVTHGRSEVALDLQEFATGITLAASLTIEQAREVGEALIHAAAQVVIEQRNAAADVTAQEIIDGIRANGGE